jgi:hypothetical protein
VSFQGLSIERVVTLLGPFFAAGASFVTGFVAQHTGVKLDPAQVGIVETGAFLGTTGLVIKWLHGRQIPAIAGLHITQAQLDELHNEVAAYLKSHSDQLTAAESQIGDIVQSRLDAALPQYKVDIDAVVAEVLKRLGSLAAAAPPATVGGATPGGTA